MSLTSEVPPKAPAKLNRVDQVKAYLLTLSCVARRPDHRYGEQADLDEAAGQLLPPTDSHKVHGGAAAPARLSFLQIYNFH